ncbi:hypothetical protein MMC25_004549 [Agyrium rufum]|nr:hypothetical protein [Agyrium rufum]
MVGIPYHSTLAQIDLFDVLGLDPTKPAEITVQAIMQAARVAALIVHPDKAPVNMYIPTFPTMEHVNDVRDYLLARDGRDDGQDTADRIAMALLHSSGYRSSWNPQRRNTPGVLRPIPRRNTFGYSLNASRWAPEPGESSRQSQSQRQQRGAGFAGRGRGWGTTTTDVSSADDQERRREREARHYTQDRTGRTHPGPIFGVPGGGPFRQRESDVRNQPS